MSTANSPSLVVLTVPITVTVPRLVQPGPSDSNIDNNTSRCYDGDATASPFFYAIPSSSRHYHKSNDLWISWGD